MEEASVETGVDALIALLKERKRLGIKEAADELKISESFVQSWVDFLVEEKVIGIEYKFTKPYIFLNKDESDSKQVSSKSESPFVLIKKDYFDRAKDKHIPEEKALALWEKHLDAALEKRRNFFVREMKKRSLSNVEGLMIRYKEHLMRL